MNPIIKAFWTAEERARLGIRGIDAFTAEELAQLQQKVEQWIRQRAPKTGSTRRQPLLLKQPNPAALA